MNRLLQSSWSILLQTVKGAPRSLILALLLAPCGFAILDTNNNGISDIWEREFNAGELFPANFDPQADEDKDSWNNMEEAAAGTDPNDANPPDGIIRPATEHVPAVIGEQNGVPVVVSSESIKVRWPTLTGKQYTLLYSPDLTQGSWLPVGDPVIASGGVSEYVFYEVNATDKCFWRVAVTDVDSDGDGLTDHEEDQSGSNPSTADTDGDNLTDLEEAEIGTDSNNPDTDDDELGDAEDAVPLDEEINWPKTQENRYVWIEQVMNGGSKAVSRHGHILFPYSSYGSSNLSNVLWDSSTSSYVALTGASSWSGSGFLSGNDPDVFDAEWMHIDDMNDDGVVVGRSELVGRYEPVAWVLTSAIMKWQMTGTATDQYADPIYIVPGFEYLEPWGDLEQRIADDSGNAPRIADDGTISALSWYVYYDPAYNTDWVIDTDWVASNAQVANHSKDMTEWATFGMNWDIQYRSGAVIGAAGGLLIEHDSSVPKTVLHYRNGAAAESLEGLLPSTAYEITNTDIGRTPATSESPEGRIWFSVNHAGGDAAFLEKREGGSGVSRWDNPPSMGEGAIRLNARGEAITGGKAATQSAAAIPPKIWRNGKYTDLNDEKLTSKPTTVTINHAIDLASNGIILAQAAENGVTKTGLLLPVELKFVEPDDETWTQIMPEKRVVADDKNLRFKLVIKGLKETRQNKLVDMGFHHLHFTTSGTRPLIHTRMNLFGPSTEISVVGESTEIRVKLNRSNLKQLDLIPQSDDDDFDGERSTLDNVTFTESNFTDSAKFIKVGVAAYRGYSKNDNSVSLRNELFKSGLDRTFIQAAGAENLIVKVEDMPIEEMAMVMNQADVFYYSGHGLSDVGDHAANPGDYHPGLVALDENDGGGIVHPSDLSPYWSKDLNVAVIAGCAVLNINNWVPFPAYFPPTIGPGVGYWPGKVMEDIGPPFLVGYAALAPSDNQNSKAIAAAFISDYESNDDAFASWRDANDNTNGRNACAIQRGAKYGYFLRSTFLGIPYYSWTEKPKIGDWNP